MSRGKSFSVARARGNSASRTARGGQVPRAAALAVLAAMLLAGRGTPLGVAITVLDTTSGTTGNDTTGSPSNQTDYPISGSLPFTVSSATSLSCNIASSPRTDSGFNANPVIEWNSSPLTKGIVQVSSVLSYVYATLSIS